jgi:replicative DNA helicase
MGAPGDVVLRVPPHSIEAEQSLLGALLLDNGALDRMAPLTDADFYSWEHRHIFGAIRELVMAQRPADVVTVHERLQRTLGDQAADIGVDYLNALASTVPNGANAPAYSGIVAERSTRRRMIALLEEVSAAAFAVKSRDGAEALIDKAVTGLMALADGKRNDEPSDMGPLATAFIDDLQARADGHTDAFGTGLRDLDRLTSEGGRRGEVWVIGARPSMGKTAFSLSLCRAVGVHAQVLMLTQEDSLGMLMGRHVAAAGGVNLAHIRNPRTAPQSMWSGVTQGVAELAPLRVAMDDQAGLTLADVRRKVQQVKRKHGDCALVVIDYLQLMDCTADGENRNQALGALANGLKRMAKELRVWVVLLSQLNREADKRKGAPEMADLRDSGDIEGAADIIGLLFRRVRWTKKEEDKNLCELHVCKHKNGPTDTLRFYFDGSTQRFSNWQDMQDDDGGTY